MMTRWTIGIDEAGRGPLAGPVAVGVFAVSEAFDHTLLTGIRDSKTLSEKKRESWYALLTEQHNTRWAVGLASADDIDRCGIVAAVRKAMTHALSELELHPGACRVLLDGSLRAPVPYAEQTTIVRGDATVPVISAAAILAKVTRDRHMQLLDQTYPEYGFAGHKGYGTALHRAAIVQYGLSPEHRTTFCQSTLAGCPQDAL